MKLIQNNTRFPAMHGRPSSVRLRLAGGAALSTFCIILNAAAEPEGTVWSKYNNVIPTPTNTVSTDGRIPLGTSGTGDVGGVLPKTVIGGITNQMWYTGSDGSFNRIYYAISPDGLTWTKYTNAIPANSDTTSTGGRIPRGNAGKGDANYAYTPAVIKEGNTYQMWYGGYDGFSNRIYYATSSNGLDWTKYNNAIPTNSDTTSTDGRIPCGSAGKGDAAHANHPAVIKDGSTYKMWYVGNDGTNNRIYYATSPDGLTWTKYNNAIPTNSDTTSTDGRIPRGIAGKGDAAHAYYPAVIKEGNTYQIWYGGSDGTNVRIYYATSPDGLTWTKYNNTTPSPTNTTSTGGRVPRGTAGTGDAAHASAPAVIKVGYTYYMWYAGYAGDSYW
ncbi:MAG: hypothetical protein HYV36_09150, partial [Lentisphaerae bacterium]|nr:hypothetical protein [Lentisphaerota bacterium]